MGDVLLLSLRKLPFRKALVTLALVPLAAVVGLGMMVGFKSYQEYERLQRARIMAELAYAGGELMLTVPLESMLPPSERPKTRTVSDATYNNMIEQLDRLKALGYNDELTLRLRSNLETAYSRMSEYRQKQDAGDTDPLMPLRYAKPVVQAGMAMASRAGGLTDDVALARDIRGYHAWMKVNEGQLLSGRMGQIYIQKRSFSKVEQALFDEGSNQIRNFDPDFRAFVSKPIQERVDAFFASPDGKVLTDIYAAMASLEDYKGKPEVYDAFTEATGKRTQVIAGFLRENGQNLIKGADARLNAAWFSMVAIISGVAAFVVLVIALGVLITRSLSSSILGISKSMTVLAEGNTAAAIPYTDRRDEIGTMAHSVEVFRQAALRNAELEAEADGNRARMEAERATLQAEAEREADERLRQATGALAASLRRLAGGDMLCDIHQPLASQFESLRADFNSSVAQLRETLKAVGSTVTVVAGGSREISDASDNLARRTEQQAASLEETAAALEQITANVTSTSHRTIEAREVVRHARNQAEKSGSVVRNAVTAMERIEQASRQINQIISVIDEIAFQTNLLALNAGVEAARAGEAGKGFAVVAQEVRELAQRSANAAKEIKGLIANSTAAVSEGVKLVSDTGQGLTAIEELVLTINTHMDAIATAAHEQSSGLAEVNTAVNHMDQATQQNAAMVEEMNAAGAGLAGESHKLHELIARFQLVQAGPGTSSGSALRQVAKTMRQPSASAIRSGAAVSAMGSPATASQHWEEF
ncbi:MULTISPECIES: methyl-accepting chemotaxis protein [Rhizobium]|uniref:Methyl-accepting chemotaxis protein n=1 Tax=Rhizobium rhizoryzae TaxID=451876 RepID=A0A7W6PNS6_9HYPH|nr:MULTISPECIES: methyl-accepting chemotaxis protein [Rhizobium]MBB4141763.1 methyl-accepting chemotaxis protein [Rhizobium rhizoryzae]